MLARISAAKVSRISSGSVVHSFMIWRGAEGRHRGDRRDQSGLGPAGQAEPLVAERWPADGGPAARERGAVAVGPVATLVAGAITRAAPGTLGADRPLLVLGQAVAELARMAEALSGRCHRDGCRTG